MDEKKKSEKKEVHEIVEIEKDGKEKVKEFSGKIEEEPATKSQIKKENKQLKIVLMVIGIIVLIFVLYLVFNYSVSHFNYKGVNFKIVKEGNIIFYDTSFKKYNQDKEYIGDHHFYIRNDPRRLEDIPFNGDLVLTSNMVINMTDEFTCGGYGLIAVANFVSLNEFLGIKVIQDPEAGCELTGKYTFVKILPGDETKIVKYGPSCYGIYINECEILEGTERFMLETFIEANNITKE